MFANTVPIRCLPSTNQVMPAESCTVRAVDLEHPPWACGTTKPRCTLRPCEPKIVKNVKVCRFHGDFQMGRINSGARICARHQGVPFMTYTGYRGLIGMTCNISSSRLENDSPATKAVLINKIPIQFNLHSFCLSKIFAQSCNKRART